MVGSLGDDDAAAVLVRLIEDVSTAADLEAARTIVVRHALTGARADAAVLSATDIRGGREVLASVGVPLSAGPPRLVALSEMHDRAVVLELHGVADTAGEDTLAPLAAMAGLLLRHVDRIGNLQEAMVSRALIGQAQGIAMARYGLSSDQAMAYLRRTSQQSHVKVRELAAQMVAEADARTDPSPAPS